MPYWPNNPVRMLRLKKPRKRLFADANVTNDEKRAILTKLFTNISLKDNIVSVTYTKLAQAIALNSVQSKEILGYAN
jgi:hypothetical protein